MVIFQRRRGVFEVHGGRARLNPTKRSLNVRNPLLVRQAQWRFSIHLPRALTSGARGLQPGVTARCYSARAGVGKRRGGLQFYQLGAAWGATGQLSGIWLGLWVSASGGAAQSASMFMYKQLAIKPLDLKATLLALLLDGPYGGEKKTPQ